VLTHDFADLVNAPTPNSRPGVCSANSDAARIVLADWPKPSTSSRTRMKRLSVDVPSLGQESLDVRWRFEFVQTSVLSFRRRGGRQRAVLSHQGNGMLLRAPDDEPEIIPFPASDRQDPTSTVSRRTAQRVPASRVKVQARTGSRVFDQDRHSPVRGYNTSGGSERVSPMSCRCTSPWPDPAGTDVRRERRRCDYRVRTTPGNPDTTGSG
jgi:hypothetical protein